MEKIGHIERNILLLVPIIILLVALIPLDNIVLQRFTLHCSTGIPGLNGLSAATSPDGELIGLSYGTTIFDTASDLHDVADKQNAAHYLRQGDTANAALYWASAINEDPADAEPKIYQENQLVSDSRLPSFTIVLGMALTGDIEQGARAALQGAYVAQHEYNQSIRGGAAGKLLRLLIANGGSNASFVTDVACQIEQVAHADSSIVEVMGWDYSSASYNAASVLESVHIPMLSANSSSDILHNVSPYFWRIVPSDNVQAAQSAIYAKNEIKAKTAVLFEDSSDYYSKSLGNDFDRAFGHTTHEMYTRGSTYNNDQQLKPTDNFLQQIQAALDLNPDVIFFSGYWTDASAFLHGLSQLTTQPTYRRFATLPIMGGDGLFTISRYNSTEQPDSSHLTFTSFASPDEWQFFCSDTHAQECLTPSFLQNYKGYFDPHGVQPQNTYGADLPDAEAILAYDATQTLIVAYQRAYRHDQSPTSSDIQLALGTIKGGCSIQGVSGQISFDANHEPDEKALVLVQTASDSNQFKTIRIFQNFLKITYNELSSC